ncbi:hypothetical protein GUJ93_ZPchr0014g46792 [Zizania palustris]|uniref:Uncharacterized protein n=1 Tax=Zizania palustris TaxID=103762 RepID=A0A8J5W6U0_ZIZPA|nr:hypothetical protein GUJ93_ZPchr0014g46792 [Zizania palustris]
MELMEMARKMGIKVQADMSFQQCGDNVGNSVKYATPGRPSRLIFHHGSGRRRAPGGGGSRRPGLREVGGSVR